MGDRGRLMEVLTHLRPSAGWGYPAASQVSDPAVLAPRPELATTEALETTVGGGVQGQGPRTSPLFPAFRDAGSPLPGIWGGSVDTFRWVTGCQGGGPRILAFHCPHFSS